MVPLAQMFIDPFTDFGFRRIFGSEANKELLRAFLNELLCEEEGSITSLTFLKPEQLGGSAFDHRFVFDVCCENELGEKFLIEMQKAKQDFFKDRSAFYSTFPIQQQAIQGPWNFEFKAVYTVGILDFVFAEDQDDADKYLYKAKLKETTTNEVCYDKLTHIYLEMPKFTKTEDQLETRLDKWLYLLKNLYRFQERPISLQEKVFDSLFEQAAIASFSPAERAGYEESLKIYRDLINVVDYAYSEGYKRGVELGIQQGKELRRQRGLQQAYELLVETGMEPEEAKRSVFGEK